MPEAIGATRWAIAEGYIPAGSTGPAPQLTSHETVCILNAGDETAHVAITELSAAKPPLKRSIQYDAGSHIPAASGTRAISVRVFAH